MVGRKSIGSKENHKNGVFHGLLCGLCGLVDVLDPAGALPPRPSVASVISSGKYDQLMRPGAAASMECLCTRGGQNNRASLSRRVIRFEALGVSVGRETVLVDAQRAREELIIQLKAVQQHLAQCTQELEAEKAARVAIKVSLTKETVLC